MLQDGGGVYAILWLTKRSSWPTAASTSTVADGAQNGWTYPQSITTRVPCNNAVFGGDPIPGVAKQCRCGVIDDDPNMTK